LQGTDFVLIYEGTVLTADGKPAARTTVLKVDGKPTYRTNRLMVDGKPTSKQTMRAPLNGKLRDAQTACGGLDGKPSSPTQAPGVWPRGIEAYSVFRD
jgi:hypothetical protein